MAKEAIQPVQKVDLTLLCRTFPETSGVQIRRDNLIALIEKTLDSGVELLTIEGSEGMGKTTLLAQFALANQPRALSMFVKPASRFAYDPDILLWDLFNQMHFAVTAKELPDDQALDEGIFRRLLTSLQRKARLEHANYYFLVDGLDEIPSESANVRDALLRMLPFGFSHFKFVVVGESAGIVGKENRKVPYKPLLITFLTLDETIQFFSDATVSRDLIEEIFKTYNGFPAILASAKRVLQSGITPERLQEELHRSTSNLFELEWSACSAPR